jgi:hypothetical protein
MTTPEFASSGSSMDEGQSFSIIVDGLHEAADAGKHLAFLTQDIRWARVAWALSNVRKAIVDRAQTGKNVAEINPDIPSASDRTITQCFVLHMRGLRQAVGGLRQVAVYHRSNESWLAWVRQLEEMERKAAVMLRRKGSPILMPGMMQ